MTKIYKPEVVVRRDKTSNFIEVDLVWPGEYKTMMTFNDEDFVNGNAEKIVKEHVASIKRHIDVKWFKDLLEVRNIEMDMEIKKFKYINARLGNKDLLRMTADDKDESKS